MEKQTSQNPAFLASSYVSVHLRRNIKAACPRSINNSNRSPPSVSANVRVNQVVEGAVTRVTAYGAFVDLGNGQTGLVHISEIADSFIHDINQHVSVGQRIPVRVVSIDTAKNRIALSIRQALPRTSGYDRVVELGGDWGHPWGDDPETKFMDLGPRPEPRPHHWQPDPSLFQKWDATKDDQ